MKRFLLVLSILFSLSIRAQYVTIPDSNFVNYLKNNGFSQCFNATNQIDTTCPAVVDTTSLELGCFYCPPIQNIQGIEYFKKLGRLYCQGSGLNSLPRLPNSLKVLECSYNNIRILQNLPDSITYLDCQANSLINFTSLPQSLVGIACDFNHITLLPSLPPFLTDLLCSHNQLSTLPDLPSSLNLLDCSYNSITSLPALSDSLYDVNCSWNLLTSLPHLTKLQHLECAYNRITSLPPLPNSLISLDCSYNKLDSLPALDNSLTGLTCSYNRLHSLPVLDNSLTRLSCEYNLLDSLPIMSDALKYLHCNNNLLSYLPPFGPSLYSVDCSNNHLKSIPALSASMGQLHIDTNIDLYCLPELNSLTALYYTVTSVACAPPHNPQLHSYPPLDSLPLCDTTNYADFCIAYNSIQEVQSIYFNITPNPATNQLFISTSGIQPEWITVYDMNGRKMREQKFAPQIDIASLSSGVYFLEVKGAEAVGRKRFVKQ